MEEKLYSIKESTLTDIGDALRRRHGETKVVTVVEEQVVPEMIISKSPNATGFFTFDETEVVTNQYFKPITIPSASSIKVRFTYFYIDSGSYGLKIGSGIRTAATEFSDCTKYTGRHLEEIVELTFEDTDTITIFEWTTSVQVGGHYPGYYAEVYGLDADGNSIGDQTIEVEVEREVPNTYSSAEVAEAIDAIESGAELPEEAFNITGACQYRFAHGGWDWYVNIFGDRINTRDITNGQSMFYGGHLEVIPFELNFKVTNDTAITSIFNSCYELKEIPKINNLRVMGSENMFNSCYNIREIPDDIDATWDWGYVNSSTSAYNGNRSYLFQKCYSLRKYPNSFLKKGNPVAAYGSSIYSYLFNSCTSLDEILDLPFPHLNATWTSNTFGYSFEACYRAKNITFSMQEDGSPYVVKWKSQTIDLSKYIGYVNTKSYILNYNSGITADKEVKDDATYQALKEDNDWFSTNISYSRYNHDSAVNTINSLPDTSAYLASAGGTNTIKFKGQSGEKTDGGAVNTLTAEEIAVATAKGWTVTFS